MLLFHWIRARVRDAILAGVGDALARLGDAGDQAEAAARLQAALAGDQLPALPPAAEANLPPAAPGRNGHRRRQPADVG